VGKSPDFSERSRFRRHLRFTRPRFGIKLVLRGRTNGPFFDCRGKSRLSGIPERPSWITELDSLLTRWKDIDQAHGRCFEKSSFRNNRVGCANANHDLLAGGISRRGNNVLALIAAKPKPANTLGMRCCACNRCGDAFPSAVSRSNRGTKRG